MIRRLPTLLLAATVGLFAVTRVAPAQPPKADPAPASSPDQPKSAGELRKPEEQNAKLFRELAQGLLRLAQKLERSDKPEDQERAKTIRAALKVAEEAGVENQFQKLIAAMGKGSPGTTDLNAMVGQDAELTKALEQIVGILMTDDETARIRAEIARLTELLKEVKDIKRRQEILRAMTEAQKGDASKIAKTQGDLARQTKDLADRMGGAKKGDSRPEEPETKSSEPKPEAKPGEKSAEPKDDAREAKGSGKDGSESKAGKPGGEPKAGDPKEGSPSKDPKPGAEKPPAEARAASEPKAGEPKPGETKPGQPKAGDQQANAQSDPKDKGDGKGEAKPKAAGKPSSARGIGGDPKNQQQQAQNKGSGQQGSPSQSPPNPNQQANQNQTPGRKQVQEAYPHQKGAEEDLNRQDRKQASKQETKAIEALAKAVDELEKRLKQLREEEMLKTLAALEARCNRMLAMQIEVYEATKTIHAGVVKNNNQKTTADHQKSQQQATKENEIIVEADKALRLLESEGSAVAFAKVLEEVRGDMQAVRVRLDNTYVDTDTQAIEENIIAMLKDMIQALKKAQQDIQNNQSNPSNSNNKQNQKLIDLLAELRLIRAMQVQVNQRTAMYGKKYAGEQASDAIVQTELRQLSQRQVKLQDMIHKIATQANQ